MRPIDIERLVSVGRPSLSPDGTFAVYATSRPDVAADRAVGQLWRTDLPAGTSRRLTRGTADSSPRVSPDGRRIAFLRADAKRRAQVFVIDAAGGEAVQATDAPLGVGAFSWSPDGARFAYTARENDEGRYGTVDDLGPDAEPARRITGIRWHANGLGYTLDRPAQLWVVDAPDPGAEPAYEPAPAPPGHEYAAPEIAPSARRLTTPPASWSGVTWTVQGDEILAVPDEIEHDVRDLRNRLVAIAVDTGAKRELVGVAADLSLGDVVAADDGTIFFTASDVGPEGRDFIAPGEALWMLGADGPVRLTDPDEMDLGEVGSHLAVDGDDVIVHDRRRGRVRLVRVGRDGTATEVLGGDIEASGAAAAGGTIVAAVSTPDAFGELVLVDGTEGGRTLTAHGSAVREVPLATPRELTATARDGYPVHGWVATPEGEGPFPVILQIHGGPFAQYGVHLFDETQVLVDAGYAVVYCNPRGSAGYGREHGRTIRQAMGTLDYTDIIDFLDAAIADDARLDGGRVGVMGGSYGGFMTAWVIAHDHRFAGAIVERGFLDPVSFSGTSDIGSFFGDEYVGTDPERMRAQSPMAHVGEVRTPTLVMHSELDFRCPLEQATRYYSALKRQGTPAEMLVFPGEDHELSRSGRPRHRVQRFEAILDWWARCLPVTR